MERGHLARASCEHGSDARATQMRMSLLILLACLVGCQSAHVSEPLTRTLSGDDADAQLEFWHQLETRPVTCNDDAFHGLILYLDQSDPNTDYVSRVNALKSRGLLPKDFDRPADEAVWRGTLAVAISKALKIKGGLLMHLTPDNPRYATSRAGVSRSVSTQHAKPDFFRRRVCRHHRTGRRLSRR